MTYTPDLTRYQQLVYGGATRGVDCCAWSGAIITDAHTQGATKLSGRAIRLASSEPVPDPGSPGLNVDQVDAAIYKLTSGKVNLETRHDWTRTTLREYVIDGRWASVSVLRSVLVDRGVLAGFRGRHQITIHAREIDNLPVIGDPLDPKWRVASWDAVFDAAQAMDSSRRIYASVTRDLTPDYRVSIHPKAGYDRVAFWHYFVNKAGVITGRQRAYTSGFSARCTPPKWLPGGEGLARPLVNLLDGSRAGWWVDARYATEVIP